MVNEEIDRGLHRPFAIHHSQFSLFRFPAAFAAFLDVKQIQAAAHAAQFLAVQAGQHAQLACAVTTIRQRARAVLSTQFSMDRYLLTQFLLLYGLLRYDEYEPYVGTRALGLIAMKLRETGLPFCRN